MKTLRLLFIVVVLWVVGMQLATSAAWAQEETVRPETMKKEVPKKPETEQQERVRPNVLLDELDLGFVPFFGAKGSFKKRAEKKVNGWLKAAVDQVLAREENREINSKWIDKDDLDKEFFEQLPASRGRQITTLLEPIAKEMEVGGLVATWLEPKESSFDLVVLLYLPNRIRFDDSVVLSANLERSTLETNQDGEFVEKDTEALMCELLIRNFGRIVAAAGPAVAPPAPEQDQEKVKDQEKAEDDGEFLFSVFEFSREYLDNEAVNLEAVDSLREEAEKALTGLIIGGAAIRSKQSNLRAIEFDQIAAPVLDLDPNTDPRAREKALFSRAGSGEVDALIIGHVYQESKKKEPVLYVRLLLRENYQSEEFNTSWDPNWTKKDMRRVLTQAGRTLLKDAKFQSMKPGDTVSIALESRKGSATMASQAISRKGRAIRVRRGDTLFSIAKKCYLGVVSHRKVAQYICNYNRLPDCNHIEFGTTVILPDGSVDQEGWFLAGRTQCPPAD